MKSKLFKIVSTLILLTTLILPISPAIPVQAVALYPEEGEIVLLDIDTINSLVKGGVKDLSKVRFVKDYGLPTDNLSPYSQTYKDISTGKYVAIITQLPMVNADNQRLDTTWSTIDGKNFNAGINQFIATVATNKVSVIVLNDQPDGKVKKDDAIVFQPQLYIDGKEIKPPVNTPTLLPIDPSNINYINNTLEWVYSNQVKRKLRLIEGSLLGSWEFSSKPSGDIRIQYNQVGDYTLKLSQFAIDNDTELVTSEQFDELVAREGYPVVIGDSLTFYPDADPETTSFDGTTYHTEDPVDWHTLVVGAGTAGAGLDAVANYWVITIKTSISNTTKWRIITRSIHLYDTSGLPDDAFITGAVESIYGTAKADPCSITPDINVYSSAPASNTVLANGDYDSIGPLGAEVPFCDTPVTYAGWNTSGYNDFAFNAAGIAAIDKTGVTKLGHRNAQYDVADSAPAHPGTINLESYLRGYFAEQGNGYKPKLVVTYTVVPIVTTNAVSSIEETTATASGNITDIGSGNATERGFEWGTATGTYTANWTENGDFGVGNFTYGLTGLTEGELYYLRAMAENADGWGYGAEVTFLTKPEAPTGFTATSKFEQVNLSWVLGTGADNITIYGEIGSYPASRDDAGSVLVYGGTGTSANHTGLTNGDHWYYRAWSYVTEGGLEQYSDSYGQDDATPNLPLPTVVTNPASSITVVTAVGNGNITDTGDPSVNCTYRGFAWGVISGIHSNTVLESGIFSTGNFTENLTSLPSNTTIYYVAAAKNTRGWGYGAEETFNTGALLAPTNFTLVESVVGGDTGLSTITANWTMGVGANTTMVRYDIVAYPTNITDGTLAYSGNGTSCNITDADLRINTYYFSAWSQYATETSDDSAQNKIGGESMVTFALVGLIGIFIIGAVLRNIPLLWFLAGATSWGLGAWWIYQPLVASGDPVNDIMLVIAFIGGFGLMMMMAWRTNDSGAGSFSIRIPAIFGGQSEGEEAEMRNARNWRGRREVYRTRLNRAGRGRR